jgi:phytoene dehydrogenase-like protein
MYNVIVIGAGIGGLTCASKLASYGKKVLLLDKIHHIGGTSYIFKRNNYFFPMGPLSFSFPKLVNQILIDIGINTKIQFQRNHFQIISPHLDLIYSQDLNNLKEELKKSYINDAQGIELFFNDLNLVINAINKVQDWHPDYLIGKRKEEAEKNIDKYQKELEIIKKFDNISANLLLEKYIENDTLKRLLGSQGTYKPIMSMIHLAFMWNIMSIEGIWFPSCGIHGISDLIHQKFIELGGETKLKTPVKEILIEKNKAIGVKTFDNNEYFADWFVANADYKKVYLEMINPKNVSKIHLEIVKNTPYTGSELCIYLGVNPAKVNLSKMKITHLFYRKVIDDEKRKDPENFENKEIEICLWSDKMSEFAPRDKKSLILRVNMPYKHFEKWRIGEKKRNEGYKEYKKSLAFKLINIVEDILPGLSNSIEIMEIATPLTYRDWGQRFEGSVAGWSRDIKRIRTNTKLLTENPIKNLLMVGIYSVLEPFLGGYPVSMYTGNLAADLIMERSIK